LEITPLFILSGYDDNSNNSNSVNGESDVDMEANNHNNGCQQEGHEDMGIYFKNTNQSV